MISIVVPTYNAQDTLGACLAALQDQRAAGDAYEIIVVDDGSTDRSAEIARQHGVRVIQQPNAGPAAARNRGAREAHGSLLLFTDADCEPAPDWIVRMTAPFADPEVTGAKGVYRTRQRQVVPRFVQLEYETRYERMAYQAVIDFVDTYSAAYRRDVFLANGGFDTVFPTASVEDQEFSFRLARKGYRLIFVPQAVVYHRHDRNLGEYWRRKFGIGFWKALLLRWHPGRAIRDSHTPQVLKVQIALAALLVVSIPVALLWSPARWAVLTEVLLFVLAAAPFCWRAIGQGVVLGALAPSVLLVRALALGSGLAVGALRFTHQGEMRKPPIGGLNRVIKRAIDVVGSVVGLVISAPLLPVVAAAIKLDSPGPVFFCQERVGENGVPFRCLKLRTMVDGAQDMLDLLVDLDALPSPAFKLHDDPRVTRVGSFLRRTSIDELPQLWNVLRGEMSLVGPRPEEARVVRLYTDWHRGRLAVKPGITGPMQVEGRADLDLDDRVRLELEYIDNHSLWRDLELLVRTVAAVVSGRGAY